MNATNSVDRPALSEQEAALYDRQMRLWGLQGQSRISAASILLVGADPVGAEIAKNVLLSGVKQLTLLDADLASESDVSFSLFLSKEHLNQPRGLSSAAACRAVNPFVNVLIEERPLESLSEADFAQFALVLLANQLVSKCRYAIPLCRRVGVHICCVSIYGMYAYILSDYCQNHWPKLTKRPENDVQAVSSFHQSNSDDDNLLPVELPTCSAKLEPRGVRQIKPCVSILTAILKFELDAGNRWTGQVDDSMRTSLQNNMANIDGGRCVEERLKKAKTRFYPVIPIVAGCASESIFKAITDDRDSAQTRLFVYDAVANKSCNLPTDFFPEIEQLLSNSNDVPANTC